MLNAVVAFGAAAVAFLAMDAVWLSQMNQRLYQPQIGALLAAKPALAPAVFFYLTYVFAMVYFAVLPALKARSLSLAARNGAVLGFCAYATYDLTNQATLRIWSTEVSVFDLAWGVFATAVASSLSFLLTRAVTGGGLMFQGRSAR